MVDRYDLGLDDEFAEEAHEFEVDLNCVVVVNRNLTLEGIDRSEHEELSRVQEIFAREDHEVLSSELSHVGNFYDDLRRAANNLAVVGLVTRLQHWIIKFAKDPKLPKSKKRKSKKSKLKKSELVAKLELLNAQLGESRVPLKFFQDLVNVRDSVIHHDSRAEWKDQNETRRVEKCYTHPSYGYVELDAEQLKEAIANAVEQVKWYDERLSKYATSPAAE